MGPNDHYIHEVVGLNISGTAAVGFVAFAHSRGGTPGLWKDYFLKFVIPHLTQCRTLYGTKVSGAMLYCVSRQVLFTIVRVVWMQNTDGTDMHASTFVL